jgi:hypothetical protein
MIAIGENKGILLLSIFAFFENKRYSKKEKRH